MTASLILLVISAIGKAFQDSCKINIFPRSWTWWNEKTSWTIKDNIENWITGKQIDWLEWLFHNVLVWITDGWHFFQMLFINTGFVGSVLFGYAVWDKNWWILLLAAICWKTLFQGVYSLLKLIFNHEV